ncbi:RNA polymerase sigma factor [Microbacterium sp. NPDC056234]|uniref:RNA polymerase sigma factor n=1 Tax=Microbacterium sp. NPDC056234 TaxID=3345757 RepID=UPI0035DD532F
MTRRILLSPQTRDWVEAVVDANADDLLRYFMRRVNPPEDAADLLAKVFLALWEKGGRVPTTNEGARMWCFGIARNVLREHRRNGKKAIDLARTLRDYLHDAPKHHSSAAATAESRMRASDIRRAMTLLNDRARELLILIYWDNFSIADAARLLSVNESTARTLHARALRRLEVALEADETLPPVQRSAQPSAVPGVTQ